MKLGKIVILVAAFILSFLVSWLFLYMWGHNPIIVTLSPYDVNVPGKPLISAKVYSLKPGDYLLVLTDVESGRREGYWFNPRDGRIGVPAFPTYLPLGNRAVISKTTLDGFTYLGEYVADWETKNNNIAFTIKGPSEAVRAARDLSPENLKSELSFGMKVIMKTRE
ncbi:MAG: hypothetical protein ABR913_06850 [Sedimentisphaerales bacterium]|jgi:hypothetical protein